MANKTRLRVATPDNVKFDDEAELVIMRCISGDIGVMAHHEATSAILDHGVLRILGDSNERRIAVFGGIAQVRDNTVTLIANAAQWPEEIDVAFAESQRNRLESQIKENPDSPQADKDFLRQCLVQIEVGNYLSSGKTEHSEIK